MKKTIILCAILIAFSKIIVNAQEINKHEIHVNYSDGLPISFIDNFSSALSSAILEQKNSSESKSFGNIGLGYKYQISERIRIGGDIAYQQEQTDFMDKNKKIIGKKTSHYFIAMPTVTFSYVKTPWLDFYGRTSAGVIMERYSQALENNTHYQDNNIDFAFQVNPVGIRVGNKFGAFAELGYGSMGFGTIGLNYMF